MKKVLIVEGAYPINIRTQKIVKQICSTSEFDVAVCSWNRDDREIMPNVLGVTEYIYINRAKYGSKVAKSLMFLPYTLFVRKSVNSFKPDVIIASHWDMLFICSLLRKTSTELIYDNIDMPTSENKFIYGFFKIFENIALLKTSKMILASRFYKSLYLKSFKGEVFIVENLPFREIQDSNEKPFVFNSKRPSISFIGSLRYFSVMKNLIDACKDLDIDLLFFGDGPEKDLFVEYSKNSKNVFYFGRYRYEHIKSIYDMSDFIWAVYPSRDPNVQYAISNKFFESMLFNKPCFFAHKTKLGDFVENSNIGYTVDPYSVMDIKQKLTKVLVNKSFNDSIKLNILNYSKMNKLFWEEYSLDFVEILS